MSENLPTVNARLAAMRAATPARILLPPAGAAVATKANLAFQLAHAEARDAVEDRLDAEALAEQLGARGLQILQVESSALNRRVYLMRPDLGRRLNESARARLLPFAGDYDLVFVIADGLSARAVAAHAGALLDAALPALDAEAWRIGPIVIVSQGRVAIGDEIGELMGAKLVAVLIGERPGLSSPDSLGVYLTFAPRVGRTDAERNCLSNIRREGMSYAEAAARLVYLASEARRRKLSGVELKDESAFAVALTSSVGEQGDVASPGNS
jgi:ethanolamine ammonia-lyase small subunit